MTCSFLQVFSLVSIPTVWFTEIQNSCYFRAYRVVGEAVGSSLKRSDNYRTILVDLL